MRVGTNAKRWHKASVKYRSASVGTHWAVCATHCPLRSYNASKPRFEHFPGDPRHVTSVWAHSACICCSYVADFQDAKRTAVQCMRGGGMSSSSLLLPPPSCLHHLGSQPPAAEGSDLTPTPADPLKTIGLAVFSCGGKFKPRANYR